jgi:ATP-dependent Zn protease
MNSHLPDDAQVPDHDGDEATAYHEAGHAIIALVLGRPVEKVTIQGNTLRLGQCQMSNRRGSPIKDEVEVHALILLAGVASEARITGFFNWNGAQQDLQGIRRLARFRATTERQEERLQQRWLDKVEYMLDDESTWKAIADVAKELLEKRSLSGRTVAHILNQCTKES